MRCEQELCPNWSGDGDVCPCAIFGVRPLCKCGHVTADHDAGECWYEVSGRRCQCPWFELVATA